MPAVKKIETISSLKRFTPLDELDDGKLTILEETSTIFKFKKGQSISSTVESQSIVYLLSGSVQRAPNSLHAELIKADSEEARRPILSPENYAPVVAMSKGSALCLDEQLLDLLYWGSNHGVEVDEIDTDDSTPWLDTLMQSDILLSLSPPGMRALMEAVEAVEFKANQLVFSQGDEANYYYIISEGSCTVSRLNGQETPQVLEKLNPGDAFGEEELITNSVRNTTIRTSVETQLLRLDQKSFKELLEQPLINTISAEHAETLEAGGAQLLDVRPGTAFARDGKGINIPFDNLRNQIESLDRSKNYIVVSDDSSESAIATFMLSQKQITSYRLGTPTKKETDAKSIGDSVQVDALKMQLSQLQIQLNESNSRLKQKSDKDASSIQQIELLTTELKNSQSSARDAIIEASSLKSRSESLLRSRISEFSKKLDLEQQKHSSISNENRQLNSNLESVSRELHQTRQNESNSNKISNQLEHQLTELQREHKQLLAEKQSLSGDASDRAGQANEELFELKIQLQNATEKSDKNLLEKSETLDAQQKVAQQLIAERDALEVQLKEARELSELQGGELDELFELKTQLQESAEQILQNEKNLLEKSEALEDQQEIIQQFVGERDALESQLKETKELSELQGSELDELFELKTQLQEATERTLQSEENLLEKSEALDTQEKMTQQIIDERDALDGQLKELAEFQSKKLDELQDQLEGTRMRADRSDERLAKKLSDLESSLDDNRHLSLQLEQSISKFEEQEASLKQQDELHKNLTEERDKIVEHVNDLNHTTTQQSEELESLHGELRTTAERADSVDNELQKMESELASQNKKCEALDNKIDRLEQIRSNLESETVEQKRELKSLTQITGERDTLQQDIKKLEDENSHYSKSSTEHKREIRELSAELNHTTSTATKESQLATDEISKQKLRNDILTSKLDQLKNENRRSNLVVRTLLFLIVLTSIASGIAYYMGIDLQTQAILIQEEARPQIERLINALPLP